VLGFSVRVVDERCELRELVVGFSIAGGGGRGRLAGANSVQPGRRWLRGFLRGGGEGGALRHESAKALLRGRALAGSLTLARAGALGPGRGLAAWTSSQRRSGGRRSAGALRRCCMAWAGAASGGRAAPGGSWWAAPGSRGASAASPSATGGSTGCPSGSSSWRGRLASSTTRASGALGPQRAPGPHAALRGLLRARHARRGGGACARLLREGCGQALRPLRSLGRPAGALARSGRLALGPGVGHSLVDSP